MAMNWINTKTTCKRTHWNEITLNRKKNERIAWQQLSSTKWKSGLKKRQKGKEEKVAQMSYIKSQLQKTRKTQTKLEQCQTNGLCKNIRIVQMAHWEIDGKKYAIDWDWDGWPDSAIENLIFFPVFRINFFDILCVMCTWCLCFFFIHLSIDVPHIIAITIMSSHTLSLSLTQY